MATCQLLLVDFGARGSLAKVLLDLEQPREAVDRIGSLVREGPHSVSQDGVPSAACDVGGGFALALQLHIGSKWGSSNRYRLVINFAAFLGTQSTAHLWCSIREDHSLSSRGNTHRLARPSADHSVVADAKSNGDIIVN